MKNKITLIITSILMALVFIITPNTQSYASSEQDLMNQYEEMTGLDFKKVENVGNKLMSYEPITIKIYNKLKDLHVKSKNINMTHTLNIGFVSIMGVFILYLLSVILKEILI